MVRYVRLFFLLAAPLLASACAHNPVPVDKPCGVIEDSLSDVRGRTAKGDQRISAHFERGVRAGCWDRKGADKPDLGVPSVAPTSNPPVYEKQTRVQRIFHRPAATVSEAVTPAAPVESAMEGPLKELGQREEAARSAALSQPPIAQKTRWQRFKDRVRHPFRKSDAT